MDAAIAIAQGLASREGEVYSAVSDVITVAKLAAAAKSRIQVAYIAWWLYRANRTLKGLFDVVDDVQSGKYVADPNAEPVTPQRLQNIADSLDYVARVIDYHFECMKRAGLTNNSMTAGAAAKFKSYSEPMKDLVDWIDVLSKPDHLQSVFDHAKEEKERGELVDLSRIE